MSDLEKSTRTILAEQKNDLVELRRRVGLLEGHCLQPQNAAPLPPVELEITDLQARVEINELWKVLNKIKEVVTESDG